MNAKETYINQPEYQPVRIRSNVSTDFVLYVTNEEDGSIPDFTGYVGRSAIANATTDEVIKVLPTVITLVEGKIVASLSKIAANDLNPNVAMKYDISADIGDMAVCFMYGPLYVDRGASAIP